MEEKKKCNCGKKTTINKVVPQPKSEATSCGVKKKCGCGAKKKEIAKKESNPKRKLVADRLEKRLSYMVI